jgi:hypothetical protein
MTPDELPADREGHLEAVACSLGDGDFTRVTFPEGVAKKTAAAIRDLLKAYQEQRRALEEARAENSTLRAIRPRAYELDRPAEVLRLFRETSGYLKTCQGKCGSDTEGRKHAMTALDAAAADLRAALNQKGDER